MRKITLRQRLGYAFDNTMSRGAVSLVGWLAVATLLLIVLFSVIVLAAGIAPASAGGHKPGVFRQLFNTFVHALDSGAIGGDSGHWPFIVLMICLTIAGLLIVSALIGVISTGLDEKLQELRKGRSFVRSRERSHPSSSVGRTRSSRSCPSSRSPTKTSAVRPS